MTFTDRLMRAARHAGVGDSQSDIARALNVSRQRVNRWFKYGAEPDADQTLEIARRWKVNADWLKSGNGDMLPTPGDGLTQEERELVRNYRSATPQTRQVIAQMARAVRKSVVAVAMVIPPLLSPSPAEARPLFNIIGTDYTLAATRRRWMATMMRWMLLLRTDIQIS